MTFSKNYLSNQSQPWAREVTKRIVNIENAFRSAEVNNTTRDDQLAASFRRLDQNFYDTKEANENAIDAINKVLGLGEPDGDPIDGSNVINNSLPGAKIVANTITANEISSQYIYAGTITAEQINAGTITGINFRTAASGVRVELKNNEVEFFNNTSFVGSMYGSTDPLASQALYVDLQSSGGGFVVNAPSRGLYVVGEIGAFGGNVFATGNVEAGASIRVGYLNGLGLTFYDNGNNQLEGPGFRATGNINVAGDIFASLPTGSGSTVQVNSGNQFVKSSSSLRYKEQIKHMDIDYDLLSSMSVKTFKFKSEVQSYGEEAATIYGFIAEEVDEIGLTDFVIYEELEDGSIRPDGIRSDSISAATYRLVQMQGKKIKTLEQKVTELENG